MCFLRCLFAYNNNNNKNENIKIYIREKDIAW